MTETDVFIIRTKQLGDEFQCQFKVGVQLFAIGPRYETKDEADWMGDMLAKAMATVLEGFGVDGECDAPRLQ